MSTTPSELLRPQDELPSEISGLRRWAVGGPEGRGGELILGPEELLSRVFELPKSGIFAEFRPVRAGGRLAILFPEPFAVRAAALSLTPLASLALVGLLAEGMRPWHDSGRGYGLLHPDGLGFDARGQLRVRPTLHRPELLDPDPGADEVATDCYTIGAILAHLWGAPWPPPQRFAPPAALEGLRPRAELLLGGLMQRRARVRMQPARAAHQAILALMERSTSPAEAALREALAAAGVGQALRGAPPRRAEVASKTEAAAPKLAPRPDASSRSEIPSPPHASAPQQAESAAKAPKLVAPPPEPPQLAREGVAPAPATLPKPTAQPNAEEADFSRPGESAHGVPSLKAPGGLTGADSREVALARRDAAEAIRTPELASPAPESSSKTLEMTLNLSETTGRALGVAAAMPGATASGPAAASGQVASNGGGQTLLTLEAAAPWRQAGTPAPEATWPASQQPERVPVAPETGALAPVEVAAGLDVGPTALHGPESHPEAPEARSTAPEIVSTEREATANEHEADDGHGGDLGAAPAEPEGVAEAREGVAEEPEAIAEEAKAIAEEPEDVAEEPVATDEVRDSVVEEPVASDEVRDSVVEEPVASDVVRDSVVEEPVASDVVRDSVIEEPVASDVVRDSVVEEPVASDVVRDRVIEEPVATDVVRDSVIEEPVATDVVRDSVIEEPDASDDASEGVADEPDASEDASEVSDDANEGVADEPEAIADLSQAIHGAPPEEPSLGAGPTVVTRSASTLVVLEDPAPGTEAKLTPPEAEVPTRQAETSHSTAPGELSTGDGPRPPSTPRSSGAKDLEEFASKVVSPPSPVAPSPMPTPPDDPTELPDGELQLSEQHPLKDAVTLQPSEPAAPPPSLFLPPPEEAPAPPWLHPEHDDETTAPIIHIEESTPPTPLATRFTPEPPKPSPKPTPKAEDDDILSRVPALEDLWLSGEIGVKANPEREKELGAGKWTEPARSREELSREMPATPSREMNVEGSSGGAVGLLLFGGALVIAFFAWRLLSPEDSALSRVFGEAPAVTVTTDPAGARVLFDGQDLGVSPAKLVIPDDRLPHNLCVYKGDIHLCQEVDADALHASETFHIDADGE